MKNTGILFIVFFFMGHCSISQSLEMNIQKFDIHDCSAIDTLTKEMDSLYAFESKCNHFYIEWPSISGESQWVNARIEQQLKNHICGLIQNDQMDSVEYTNNLTEDFVLKHNRDASAEWDITIEFLGTFHSIHQFAISHGGYYYGAAHGFGYSQYFHFNSITASEVGLKILFSENELEKLSQMAIQKITAQEPEMWTDDLIGAFYLTENFMMQESGINFYYNAYDIGPYAMGYPELLLTWEEIQSCLSH
ncbi:MAG: hypothetical protein RLY35_1388 [Bacteroidota bacterium]